MRAEKDCNSCVFYSADGCLGQCLDEPDVGKDADREMIGIAVNYSITDIGDK